MDTLFFIWMYFLETNPTGYDSNTKYLSSLIVKSRTNENIFLFRTDQRFLGIFFF